MGGFEEIFGLVSAQEQKLRAKELITSEDAENVYIPAIQAWERQGTTYINGKPYDYWANHEEIWFYEPGNDGENTVARFSVSYDLWD
jgi:hypothetical protein